MKIMHLSDLHLGKRVNGFPMLEDQKFILKQVLGIMDDEKPDACLIAGDVYDKQVPPVEAVSMLDDFLCEIAKKGVTCMLISGNHDSAERLGFASRLVREKKLFMAGTYPADDKVTLEDGYGEVDFYLLPFIKPAQVRAAYPGEDVRTYTDAVKGAIWHMGVNSGRRNVLVAHQCVTGATGCESEDVVIGGTENVDSDIFGMFDYVALGHLHRPQDIGEPGHIRYCGTPLKYSFSEAGDEKSVTVLEMGKKGDLAIRTVPLAPMRDMREAKGKFEELTSPAFLSGSGSVLRDSYLHVTLTDEDDVIDAVSRLRKVFPYLMKMEYENTRTKAAAAAVIPAAVPDRPLDELFKEFYGMQNGKEMEPEQEAYIGRMFGIDEDKKEEEA